MFDDYDKKLHKLGQDVPKIFDKETIKGSLFFISEAVKKTNKEKLVDTGNYKRNWNAKHENKDTEHKIIMFNNVEYASHLEWGHRLRNGVFWKGKFVGHLSVKATRKYILNDLRKLLGREYK